MTPFELPFEIARLWLGLTAAAMDATNAALQASGQQTAQAMAQATGTSPVLPWMVNPWASMPFPMAPAFGGSPFSGLPFGFTNPWSAWLGPWVAPTPAQQLGTAWMWPWAAATSVAGPMTLAWMGRPAAGVALMDQVASSYRTASGFASAAIVQSFDPRLFGSGLH
jgi:hypothetical protein